jgi:hypothetical protein
MGVSNATPTGTGTPTDPYVYSTGWVDLDNYAALAGATFTGKVNTPVTGAAAGLNIGQSSGAPSSPVNGDLWLTASGLYARVNGSSVGPFATGAPAFSDVTAGENTAALTIGNSGSLSTTGTGYISSGGVVLGDSSPDANGEIGYASNAYSLFANSEDLSLTAGTNMWTFNSSTSAAFTFTPAVTITGLATLSAGATIADSQVLTFDESAADPNDADVQISATDGVLKFAAANGANNEALTVDLDATANEATVSSSTGVNLVRLTQGIAMGANIPVVSKGESATLSVAEMNSSVYVTAAATLTLPEVVASSPSATQVTPGTMVCVYSTGANVVRINPNDADGIRMNSATRGTNGVDIYSAGAAGNFICIQADSASGWTTWGASGTWTAGS